MIDLLVKLTELQGPNTQTSNKVMPARRLRVAYYAHVIALLVQKIVLLIGELVKFVVSGDPGGVSWWLVVNSAISDAYGATVIKMSTPISLRRLLARSTSAFAAFHIHAPLQNSQERMNMAFIGIGGAYGQGALEELSSQNIAAICAVDGRTKEQQNSRFCHTFGSSRRAQARESLTIGGACWRKWTRESTGW